MTESEPADDALFEQAERFRARLADAPCDRLLLRRVADWRAADPAHEQAFVEAERLWSFTALPAAAIRRDAHRGRGWPLAGLAAGVAALLLLSPALVRGFDDWRADAVAGVGERRDLVLADGSHVAINSDTALAFDMAGDRREVRLYRGEAFFAVTHDAARPFRIRAGDSAVVVLGTRFDVRLEEGRTRVTVEQGRVRIAGPGGTRDLAAGVQGLATAEATTARAVHAEDEAAWRRGRAVYYDAPLPRVVADLERYQGRKVWLASESAHRRRVTGAFRTDRPAETLDAIRASLGLRSLTLPGVVVLY